MKHSNCFAGLVITVFALMCACAPRSFADPAASPSFGPTIKDTAHLAGMNNDFHTTLDVAGDGSIIAGAAGFYLVSGNATPISKGRTDFSVNNGNTVLWSEAGETTLTGTSFLVTAPPLPVLSASENTVMAGVQGPLLQVSGGGSLASTGTDDYATFQALLDSATTTMALVVYIDSDFTLSNTPIVRSNTTVIGVGGHMWHMGQNCNEHGIGTVLTGATISSSNIVIQNLTVDCNAPSQHQGRREGNGFLQGADTPTWVFGGWFGSCNGVELDNLTMLNSCTFSLVFSHAYHVITRGYRNIWTNQEPPVNYPIHGMNHDGMHLWGPDSHMKFFDSDFMGDDNQMAICQVEKTPEGTGVPLDIRRGHGGPVSDITWDGVILRNAAAPIRIGGQTATTGTAAFENTADNLSYLNITGTSVGPMSFTGLLGTPRVTVSNWGVVSGTSAAGASLVFTNNGDYELDNIRSSDPVYFDYQNSIDPNSNQIGGSYAAEMHGLRNGCIAAWNLTAHDTTADLTENGRDLTNKNGVPFTSPTSGSLFGSAATFTSGSSQELVLEGSKCPNLSSMREFTVTGWEWISSALKMAPLFSFSDAALPSTPGFRFGYVPNYIQGVCGVWRNDLIEGSPTRNYFGAGHWLFYCARKRSSDGAINFSFNTPDGGLYSQWSRVPMKPVTTPLIEIGGMESSGPNSYFTGYICGVFIWNRCLTDREVYLVSNLGTDGISSCLPGVNQSDGHWGGRKWPFNY